MDKKLLFVSVFVIFILIIIILLNMHIHKNSATLTPEIKQRIKHIARKGFSKAAQSKQDKNPLVALMHCTAASAYLSACQHLSGGSLTSLEREFGVNIETDLKSKLMNCSSRAIRTITSRYPKLSIKGAEHFSIAAGWMV